MMKRRENFVRWKIHFLLCSSLFFSLLFLSSWVVLLSFIHVTPHPLVNKYNIGCKKFFNWKLSEVLPYLVVVLSCRGRYTLATQEEKKDQKKFRCYERKWENKFSNLSSKKSSGEAIKKKQGQTCNPFECWNSRIFVRVDVCGLL